LVVAGAFRAVNLRKARHLMLLHRHTADFEGALRRAGALLDAKDVTRMVAKLDGIFRAGASAELAGRELGLPRGRPRYDQAQQH
jgi:hypothetical protein